MISKLLLTIAIIGFGIRQVRLNMKNVEERKPRMINETCKKIKELCCCLGEIFHISMADVSHKSTPHKGVALALWTST